MHNVIEQYVVEVMPGKSPASQKSNSVAVNRLRPTFGHMRPGDIKPQHGYRYRVRTTGKKLIIEWDQDGELHALIDAILTLPRSPRIQGAPLFVIRQGRQLIKADGQASGFDTLWQRFMRRLVEDTEVTHFQQRDLRAVVASESDTLQQASERLGHANTSITQRLYRRKPT